MVRNAYSCYTHFVQMLDPGLEHTRFTRSEDLALVELSSKNRGFNWQEVAKHSPGRTPWRCFSRYQQALNTKQTRSEWTPEEDIQLVRLVGQQGGCKNLISVISQTNTEMNGGRSADQLRERYTNCLCMSRKNVPSQHWGPLDLARLNTAVSIYGRGHWRHVARHVPGRSLPSMTSRYQNVENRELKRDFERPAKRGHSRSLTWSVDEDEKLLEAIERYGVGNWSLARLELPGRTSHECWCRFQRLNPESKADIYDILLATKSKMLPASSYHRKYMPGHRVEPRNRKRPRSEVIASDFKLRLMETPAAIGQAQVEEDGSGNNDESSPGKFGGLSYTVLTTGDHRLDRSLTRLNARRRLNAQSSASVLAVKDRTLDKPIKSGVGLPGVAPRRRFRPRLRPTKRQRSPLDQ